MEIRYDNLSVIRSHETPQQWAIRVRVTLQALITEEKKESFYHVFCLFASFGQGYQSKDIPYILYKQFNIAVFFVSFNCLIIHH